VKNNMEQTFLRDGKWLTMSQLKKIEDKKKPTTKKVEDKKK